MEWTTALGEMETTAATTLRRIMVVMAQEAARRVMVPGPGLVVMIVAVAVESMKSTETKMTIPTAATQSTS